MRSTKPILWLLGAFAAIGLLVMLAIAVHLSRGRFPTAWLPPSGSPPAPPRNPTPDQSRPSWSISSPERRAAAFPSKPPAPTYSVEELRKWLAHSDHRVEAAKELMRTPGAEAAIPDLRALLRRNRNPVPNEVNPLTHLEGPTARRYDEIEIALELYPPTAVTIHGSDSPREAVVAALGHLAGASAVPDLLEALEDPSWGLRLAAYKSFAEMDGQAIEALKRSLRAEKWETRAAAAVALTAVPHGVGEAAEEILVAVDDEHAVVRLHALRALMLSWRFEDRKVPLLKKLLRDVHPAIRYLAIDYAMLLRHLDDTLVQSVSELEGDPNPTVRTAAVQATSRARRAEGSVPMDESAELAALGRNKVDLPGSGPGIAMLRHSLRNSDVAGVCRNVKGLHDTFRSERDKRELDGLIGAELEGAVAASGIEELSRLLASSDREQRVWATVVLAYVGEDAEPAVDRLLAALSDSSRDPDERTAATAALGAIGAAARGAVAELRRALEVDYWRGAPGSRSSYHGAIKGNDYSVQRGTAARALVGIGEPAAEAINDVRRLANESDGPLRADLLEALSGSEVAKGEIVTTLRIALQNREKPARFSATQSLGEIGAAARVAVPNIHQSMTTAPWYREYASLPFYQPCAVKALCKILGEDALPEVRANLQDHEICQWAVPWICTLDEALIRESLPELAGALASVSQDQAERTTEVMYELGQDGRDQLRKALAGHSFARHRAIVAVILRRGAAEKFLPELVQLPRDRSTYKDLARDTFLELGAPVIPTLLEYLDDPSIGLREGAVRALGDLAAEDTETIVPALIECLGSDSLNVQTAALIALRDLSHETFMESEPPVIPSLLECLDAPSIRLREGAVRALGNVGATDAETVVPALIECLRSGNRSVRTSAAIALGDLGAHSEPAIGALEDVQEDKAGTLIAKRALERIRADLAAKDREGMEE